MGSTTFVPTTATVAVSTPVTWVNDSGVIHDVTFETPTAAKAVGNGAAGNIGAHASGTNQRQFTAAGSYNFHCSIHGAAMHGTVVVQ